MQGVQGLRVSPCMSGMSVGCLWDCVSKESRVEGVEWVYKEAFTKVKRGMVNWTRTGAPGVESGGGKRLREIGLEDKGHLLDRAGKTTTVGIARARADDGMIVKNWHSNVVFLAWLGVVGRGIDWWNGISTRRAWQELHDGRNGEIMMKVFAFRRHKDTGLQRQAETKCNARESSPSESFTSEGHAGNNEIKISSDFNRERLHVWFDLVYDLISPDRCGDGIEQAQRGPSPNSSDDGEWSASRESWLSKSRARCRRCRIRCVRVVHAALACVSFESVAHRGRKDGVFYSSGQSDKSTRYTRIILRKRSLDPTIAVTTTSGPTMRAAHHIDLIRRAPSGMHFVLSIRRMLEDTIARVDPRGGRVNLSQILFHSQRCMDILFSPAFVRNMDSVPAKHRAAEAIAWSWKEESISKIATTPPLRSIAAWSLHVDLWRSRTYHCGKMDSGRVNLFLDLHAKGARSQVGGIYCVLAVERGRPAYGSAHGLGSNFGMLLCIALLYGVTIGAAGVQSP
ncbi:hypothetical protein BDZ89DRAFT_1119008 [Hymenopellis radicata]|nr:hypothetical protein BDZ89DRAFT_1119008 [Hymenopellis radicata]